MNGATAEPCVKTIRLPRKTSAMMMGSNQNFLRSLIKAHSSPSMSNIEILLRSKLPQHVRARPGAAQYSIGVARFLIISPHGVLPRQPHGPPHRRDQSKKDAAQDNSCVDPAQGVAQDHP